MEFHVSKKVRDLCNFDESLFSFNGNVIFTNFKAVRTFAQKINSTMNPVLESNKMIKAATFYGCCFNFSCWDYMVVWSDLKALF